MIRLANDNDIDDIINLGNTLITNFSKTYDIKNYLKCSKYIILVDFNKTLNGFLIISRNIENFELEYIIVNKNTRKKGIASNLINNFLHNYTKKGTEIFLEVATNNEPAISLYQKFNFKIINKRNKYYGNIDAYVMKKVIE